MKKKMVKYKTKDKKEFDISELLICKHMKMPEELRYLDIAGICTLVEGVVGICTGYKPFPFFCPIMREVK